MDPSANNKSVSYHKKTIRQINLLQKLMPHWGIIPKLIKTGIMAGCSDDFHQMKEHYQTEMVHVTCMFIFIHVLRTLLFSFLLKPDNRNSFILSRFVWGPKKPFRRRSLPPSLPLSLAFSRSASCVTYMCLTTDSSQNPQNQKARLVGWPRPQSELGSVG